jgi:hypothetical protein
MPLRVLFLLLSFVIFTNLVLMLLSVIFNKNLYKTHGKLIANCYGIFILVLVVLYVSLSIAGIK